MFPKVAAICNQLKKWYRAYVEPHVGAYAVDIITFK